ncbi:hypothetical protein P4637_08875 [Halalkalibacterium halodurans]|uniref:hypothetical protein n=1 Tax=Halalkalibacterium halodurans TaxID=86665 RepID=UPI002E22FA93|nr:hypothetical protein [Halalkalibacterium halodurans]MED4084946.1 hypothetical protein [Halalkalibacterium halodurans]MED4104913.1 hypothetical protein [Halalkalibacterium halodurans]MED4110426.1 hypothetical protein [Halalkalibacterium halodurans]MED4123036.1 hypothetical protein [Halalkalibacterium halodurans]
METPRDLTDAERKLMIVLFHMINAGKPLALPVISVRTGKTEEQIRKMVDDLRNRGWLALENGRLKVMRSVIK